MLFLLPSIAIASGNEWDGEADFEIDGIYYLIISDSPPKVRVCSDSWTRHADGCYYSLPRYSGILDIPNEVTYNGTTYAVTDIHWNALIVCENLDSVTIPESVTNLTVSTYGSSGDTRANNCIKKIFVSNTNPVFNSRNDCNAIIETATNTLVVGCNYTIIPSTITSIGPGAFAFCCELNNIELPNTVTSIGTSAFYGCSGLTNFTVPPLVSAINSCVFYGCTGLETINLPSSITNIGWSAFQNCNALTSLTIPESVTDISGEAFAQCYNLVDIECLALTPPKVNYTSSVYNESNSFDCYNVATLTVPRISYNAYRNASGWKEFRKIQSLFDVEVDDIFYNITSDSTVCVTYKNEIFNSYDGNIVIPESIYFNGNEYIINAIGERAFYGCNNLISVAIPNTVKTIDNYAFYNCSGFSDLLIPESISAIGVNCFSGCSGLKKITWNAVNCSSNGNMPTSSIEQVTIGSSVEALPNGFVAGSKILEVMIPNSVKEIGSNAFSRCNELTNVNIPNSVVSIGESAFYACSGLVDLTIGSAVNIIGANAFGKCSSLDGISIPNSVLTIEESAFYACSGLKSVVIPNSVISIGYYCFSDCSNLTSVTIPNSVSNIGSSAFNNCNALNKVMITDLASWCSIIFESSTANPLYYSHHLYLNNQEIKSLSIPESVNSIGNYTFINGTAFNELALPSSLKSIGYNAFEGCTKLSKVNLPDSVESIGRQAFINCFNMTEVKLGVDLALISSQAFKGCNSLNTVISLAQTPPALANVDCFDIDCYDRTTLFVPGDKVEEYQTTSYWNKFANIFGLGIEVNNIYYELKPEKNEAIVTFKDDSYCSYTGEVVIPEMISYGGVVFTITRIGEAAFAYCDELTSVTIPNSVTSISDYAFMYCESLTSINLPNSLVSIGESAFDGSCNLNKIVIPDAVTSIGDMAFQGCTGLTDITIGSAVSRIGAKAFNYCNVLKTVTCKSSVPPIMDKSNCFTYNGYKATLRVPFETIEVYQTSDYWYKFAAIEGFGGNLVGDVNGDGGVNISDVTALIDYLLSGNDSAIELAGADCNKDGNVNISDVTALIDNLLSGNWN